jgi:hypothetical protein
MTTVATRTAPRRVIAAVLTSIPALVILVTGIVWRSSLPKRLPSHWTTDNEIDGTSSTWLLFAGTFVIAAVVAGISIATGIDSANPSSARPGFLIGGIFSGGAAAAWLTIAGITLSTPAGEQPTVGAWPLLLFALAYGLVPFLTTFGGRSGCAR